VCSGLCSDLVCGAPFSRAPSQRHRGSVQHSPRSLYHGKSSDSSRVAACRFLSGLALSISDWGQALPLPRSEAEATNKAKGGGGQEGPLGLPGGVGTVRSRGGDEEGVPLAVPEGVEGAVVDFLHWNLDLDSEAVQVRHQGLPSTWSLV